MQVYHNYYMDSSTEINQFGGWNLCEVNAFFGKNFYHIQLTPDHRDTCSKRTVNFLNISPNLGIHSIMF